MIVEILLGFALLCSISYIFFLKRKLPRIDGQIVITKDDAGKKIFSLELDKDPEDIQIMKFVVFTITDKENKNYDDVA